jgi:hypothetical protein
MRSSCTFAALLFTSLIAAQGPEVTCWQINPGNETGFGGYLTNVLNVHYTPTDVYVACTCIPGYDIGPWAGNPNTPANQDFTFKITRQPVQNTGTLVTTPMGHIGVWRNGVSIFNPRDGMSYNNQGVWNRDALIFEGSSFDACLGHPAPNGEYHHHVNPACLYNASDGTVHAPLLGYAFDGFPIYGAYGYANPDGTGGITRIRSSYRLRDITSRTTLPDGTALTPGQYGPAIGGQYPLGAFIEDHEYVPGLGDLDEHNGRFCVTPDYPDGTYAYFVTLDENGDPAYPYVLGPTYYGTVQPGNTGPQSGHNTVPGGAVVYDPWATGVVEQLRTNAQVEVFPVPITTELTVRVADGSLARVEVFDAVGRRVQEHGVQASSVTLGLDGLAQGAHVLRITRADGTRLERVVVKH